MDPLRRLWPLIHRGIKQEIVVLIKILDAPLDGLECRREAPPASWRPEPEGNKKGAPRKGRPFLVDRTD
jgi:hypothetical protein